MSSFVVGWSSAKIPPAEGLYLIQTVSGEFGVAEVEWLDNPVESGSDGYWCLIMDGCSFPLGDEDSDEQFVTAYCGPIRKPGLLQERS